MTLTPQQLVAGNFQLASLPDVYVRVDEMIESPHHSALDIGKVVAADPALTARILKLANSAFYGFPSQIDTLSRAVTVLGLRELRDIVLATTVVDMFKGIPTSIVDMRQFWRYSILSALTARVLANRRHELHSERYFVAGLLHDLGSLVMYQRIPELAQEALIRSRRDGIPLHLAEKELLGWDHSAVGGELLRLWKLPGHLQETVAHHHDPATAPHYAREATLVHIADLIVHAMEDDAAPLAALDASGWERTGLTPDVVEPTMTEVEKQFEAVGKVLYGEDLSRKSSAR